MFENIIIITLGVFFFIIMGIYSYRDSKKPEKHIFYRFKKTCKFCGDNLYIRVMDYGIIDLFMEKQLVCFNKSCAHYGEMMHQPRDRKKSVYLATVAIPNTPMKFDLNSLEFRIVIKNWRSWLIS